MKALWNNLFVPALVVALGFSAVNLQAGDHNTNGSNHASSSAKSSSGKTSSSSANASSAKPATGTSKQQTGKTSGGMKMDNASASNKGNTSPKKETTGTTKGTSNGTGSKKDTTSTGSKPTTSTSKKESPWGSNKKDSDWGGYGGKGSTTDSKGKTDSKTKPSTNDKGNTSSSKKDSPWGEQTGKGSKTTKPRKDNYPASTHKMDPCPKDMPKHKTGGHYTQEQCAPKWNSCASYNKWTNCPNQWHVSFRNSYCLPTNYCFWQKKYYDARCGCYTYFDSYSSGWYYYEPVVKCYIPVSYCEQYAEERTESLEEVDACEVEVPVCETVQNYRVLPVKPACQPYTYVRHGR